MTYQTFQEKIKECVSSRFEPGTNVALREVVKNNNVHLHGLTAFPPGCRFSLTIYLESFYRDYKNGETLDSIADQIYEMFVKEKVVNPPDLSFFLQEDEVKQRLMCRLIGEKKNRRMLEKTPHRSFLDVAVIYECMLMHDGMDMASILIRDEHMENWSLTREELHEAALHNTRHVYPPEFVPMEQLVSSILSQNPDGPGQFIFPKQYPRRHSSISSELYVLTNRIRYYGAVWMTEPDQLRQMGDVLENNYFILPSSVHECIVLPDNDCFGAENLQKMVQEINATQVDREEVLTDSVYYYDRDKEILSVAAKAPEPGQEVAEEKEA